MNLRSVDLSELIDQLDRATRTEVLTDSQRGRSSALAIAFDADGTIWDGDVGVEAFTRLVQARGVLPEAAPRLRREAEASGVVVTDDPNEQAQLLLDAFQEARLEPLSAFSMMAWAFAGRTREEMRTFAKEFVREACLHERRHAEVVDLASWCKARELCVLVVSASPEAIVRASLDWIAFPDDLLIAITPIFRDEVLQSAVTDPIPYAAGKVTAIAPRIAGRDLVAALGDSASDWPMLSSSRLAVVVRPQRALVDAAAQSPGVVELRVSS